MRVRPVPYHAALVQRPDELSDSRPCLRPAPWYGVFPGIALALLMVGLNYLTDGLRDAFDPRRTSSLS